MGDRKLAIEIVKSGGEAALKAGNQVLSFKEDNEMVSSADLASQAAMLGTITKADPDFGIISEEGLDIPGSPQWILDPLDGTIPFSRGHDDWCTVATLRDKEVLASAIWAPRLKQLYSADRDRAYLNSEEIQVADFKPLKTSLIRTWIDPKRMQVAEFKGFIDKLSGKCQVLYSGGSGALWMGYLASGKCDGWIEYFPDQKEWEWPGARLLVESAGGYAYEGGKWRIAASTEELLAELVDLT